MKASPLSIPSGMLRIDLINKRYDGKFGFQFLRGCYRSYEELKKLTDDTIAFNSFGDATLEKTGVEDVGPGATFNSFGDATQPWPRGTGTTLSGLSIPSGMLRREGPGAGTPPRLLFQFLRGCYRRLTMASMRCASSSFNSFGDATAARVLERVAGLLRAFNSFGDATSA